MVCGGWCVEVSLLYRLVQIPRGQIVQIAVFKVLGLGL